MNNQDKNKCLSMEQIQNYAEGRLMHSQMHHVEKHVLNCPLCADALEGYATNPAWAEHKKQVKLINADIDRIVKKPRVLSLYSPVWAVAAGILLMVGMYFMFRVSYLSNSGELAMEAETARVEQSAPVRDVSESATDMAKATEETPTMHDHAAPVSVDTVEENDPKTKTRQKIADDTAENKDHATKNTVIAADTEIEQETETEDADTEESEIILAEETEVSNLASNTKSDSATILLTDDMLSDENLVLKEEKKANSEGSTTNTGQDIILDDIAERDFADHVRNDYNHTLSEQQSRAATRKRNSLFSRQRSRQNRFIAPVTEKSGNDLLSEAAYYKQQNDYYSAIPLYKAYILMQTDTLSPAVLHANRMLADIYLHQQQNDSARIHLQRLLYDSTLYLPRARRQLDSIR